jgi:hypothetical protein
VAAVNPDLVARDKNGEIYTVRYDAVKAMLLNEFLKEQRKVEEQKGIVASALVLWITFAALIAKAKRRATAEDSFNAILPRDKPALSPCST